MAWWRAFLQEWNGVGFMSACAQPTATVELVSDASGSWGCGAFWGSRWLQVQWDESAVRRPIAAKELLPIILGAAIWGAQWKGLVVTCRCDNQAVVSTLLSRSSREEHMMHMLRCLFYIEAAFSFAAPLPSYSQSPKHSGLSRIFWSASNFCPAGQKHAAQNCLTG